MPPSAEAPRCLARPLTRGTCVPVKGALRHDFTVDKIYGFRKLKNRRLPRTLLPDRSTL
jgi:hypothetical protein